MELTTDEIIILLQILMILLGIIVLYHLMFAAWSLRKILKRAESVTRHAEELLMKPIHMADTGVEFITSMLAEHQKKAAKKKAKKED